jgi:macrolide transport system ATP-binding/permease protein
MSNQLSLREVSLAYGEHPVLDHVTVAFTPGACTGLIGENGAGKSTVLRLLAGLARPDEGRVTVTADGGVGYQAQESPLPPDRTVGDLVDLALRELRAIEARLRELEPLLAGADPDLLAEYGDLLTLFELRGGYDADARMEQAMAGLGLAALARGRLLGSLSGGEQVRLNLAALLAAAPEVLLLDEPTNHLDDSAISWLEEHLRTRRGTTVAVSHDRAFLDAVATELVEIGALAGGEQAEPVRYSGGYPAYLAEKAAGRRRWAAAHEAWQAEVDRLTEAAATTARRVAVGRASTDRNKMAYDRAAGRVQQSVASRVRAAEEKLRRVRADPVPPPPEPLRFRAKPWTGLVRGEVLAASEVCVAGRLTPVSLTLRSGERLLVTGSNGAGKSTLLDVLGGVRAPDGGSVARRGRIGYLRQDVAAGPPGQTVLAAFAVGRPGPAEEHAAALLSLGLLRAEQLRLPVAALSTGQRRRLELARLLTDPVDVLLLDEPTNHLSLVLVEELEAALAEYSGALLVVSHDRRWRERWTGEWFDLGRAARSGRAA